MCAGCVYEAMRRNFYGIGFGVGLQLCWFVVASKGLFSVPGIFAAAIALYGLVRLALLLAARVALRGAKAKRGPCAGLGVEARHGPCRDGGCPARRLCRTVLQCKSADAERVRTPAPCQIKYWCKPAPGLQTEAGRRFLPEGKTAGMAGRGHLQKAFAFGSRQSGPLKAAVKA